MEKYLFSTEIIQTGSGVQPDSYAVGIKFVHGVNSSVREVNHSLSSSVKVKNEWSYTSTPPMRLHRVDKESFTFITVSIEWPDGGKYTAVHCREN